MTTPEDEVAVSRKYATARKAWRVFGYSTTSVFIVGSLGYLALTKPVSKARIEASFAKIAPVKGIATTAVDLDGMVIPPTGEAEDALKTLSGPVSRADRADLAYFLRHGDTSGEAAVLVRSLTREHGAAQTLFQGGKSFNFIEWRKGFGPGSARAGAVSLALQLNALDAIAKANAGDTAGAVHELAEMVRFTADMPAGTTPLEVAHRCAMMRQLASSSLRAAEARPTDASFHRQLADEVLGAWHAPEPPDIARVDMSVTLLFGRQLAGSEGTTITGQTMSKFKEKWSYVPIAVQSVMLEGAVKEVNRQQLQLLAVVEQGWRDDRTLGDKIDRMNEVKTGVGLITMQQAYQDLMVDQASVSPKVYMAAIRNTDVVCDLARAYLANLTRPSTPPTGIDWYSEKPYGFQASPLMIWSVGPDLTDNGGASWDFNNGSFGPRPARYDIVLSVDRYGHAQITGA